MGYRINCIRSELPSHVVAQGQLQRMRVQVGLFGQVRLTIFAYEVVQERHRYDQGQMVAAVVADQLENFPFFIC